MIALNDLNAEHFALKGTPLGNTQELVEEVIRQRTFGNKGCTLRQAWEAKYDVPKSCARRRQRKRRPSAIRNCKAHWTKEERERTGSNPHTRRGQPSRFSTYKASDAKAEKPWQASRSKTNETPIGVNRRLPKCIKGRQRKRLFKEKHRGIRTSIPGTFSDNDSTSWSTGTSIQNSYVGTPFQRYFRASERFDPFGGGAGMQVPQLYQGVGGGALFPGEDVTIVDEQVITASLFQPRHTPSTSW